MTFRACESFLNYAKTQRELKHTDVTRCRRTFRLKDGPSGAALRCSGGGAQAIPQAHARSNLQHKHKSEKRYNRIQTSFFFFFLFVWFFFGTLAASLEMCDPSEFLALGSLVAREQSSRYVPNGATSVMGEALR